MKVFKLFSIAFLTLGMSLTIGCEQNEEDQEKEKKKEPALEITTSKKGEKSAEKMVKLIEGTSKLEEVFKKAIVDVNNWHPDGRRKIALIILRELAQKNHEMAAVFLARDTLIYPHLYNKKSHMDAIDDLKVFSLKGNVYATAFMAAYY